MAEAVLERQSLEEANRIYDKLQEYRGFARLDGYLDGEIALPEEGLRIQVSRVPIDPFEKEMFKARGFDDEDFKAGIATIIERPLEGTDAEINHQYFVSATGKLVETSTGADNIEISKIVEPKARHIAAGRAIAELSKIPIQIIDDFGSFERFREVLGEKFNRKGIESTDSRSPFSLLFEGGLSNFVRAWNLYKTGNLIELRTDAANDTLTNSLDPRNSLEITFDTLEKSGLSPKKTGSAAK